LSLPRGSMAFTSADTRSWRAEAPRSQTIRLIFDQPKRLKCISSSRFPKPYVGFAFHHVKGFSSKCACVLDLRRHQGDTFPSRALWVPLPHMLNASRDPTLSLRGRSTSLRLRRLSQKCRNNGPVI
jgi:hypothetical protein